MLTMLRTFVIVGLLVLLSVAIVRAWTHGGGGGGSGSGNLLTDLSGNHLTDASGNRLTTP